MPVGVRLWYLRQSTEGAGIMVLQEGLQASPKPIQMKNLPDC